jgi:hypothetical protein
MLDFQQLSQAQQDGDKLITSLTDDERFIIAKYADMAIPQLISMGVKRNATATDLIRMGIMLGISLGVKIDIQNSQVIQR